MSYTSLYTIEDEVAEEVKQNKLVKNFSSYWPSPYYIASKFDHEAIRPIINAKLRILKELDEWLDELSYKTKTDMRDEELEFKIEWYTKLKRLINNPKGRMDIEKAKAVPIIDLYQFKIKRGRYVSCPFHIDLHPSMLINKNNTFKCFSCQRYGDSINFIQELYGHTFKDSVRFLNAR